MSKVLDFLYEKGSQALDFLGFQHGVLPPLRDEQDFSSDGQWKREDAYKLSRFKDEKIAFEKKRAAGELPVYQSWSRFAQSSEYDFVNLEYLQGGYNTGAPMPTQHWDNTYKSAFENENQFIRDFRKVAPISNEDIPNSFAPLKHGLNLDPSRLRITSKTFLNEESTLQSWQEAGYAGNFARQIGGAPLPGLQEGQRFFLATVHGGKGGTLGSHFTGGYHDYSAWTTWSDEQVQQLGKIPDLYLACCHPAYVKQKYPFLNVEHDQATNITHHSWGDYIGSHQVYSSFAELPEYSKEVIAKKAKFSGYIRGLDPARQIEAVRLGQVPVFRGVHKEGPQGIFQRRIDNLLSISEADLAKQYGDPGQHHFVNHDLPKDRIGEELRYLDYSQNQEKSWRVHYEPGKEGFVTKFIADEVDQYALERGVDGAFYYGTETAVDQAMAVERRHLRAGTWGSDEWRRDIFKAQGYTDESIALDDFIGSKEVDDARAEIAKHAYGRIGGDALPILGLSAEGHLTLDEALNAGISPEDIHEAIFRNIEDFLGKGSLPEKFFPKGKDRAAVESTVRAGMKKTVAKAFGEFNSGTVADIARAALKKTGIAGLVIGLGIGLPAVASASTGTSPTDGGLGSTLAIGAGVATIAGVGAYSYSKIRKAGINPRVVGGGAAGAAGAAGAGAAGGAAGAAAGAVNRNTGSRIYNSAFVQNELDLTTRGFFAGIGSVINDFGFNRRTGSFDTSGAPDSFIDSLFGKALKQDGYVHPVFRAEEATWKIANNLQDAYQGWKDYINTSYQNSSGIGKLFQGVRYHGFKILDSVGDGWLNKQLVKAGGFSTVIAPALMAHGALGDFKEGYRRGGLIGGALKTVTGLISGLVQNKVIAGILLNPMTGLLGAGITAAAGYAAFKIFDVRNEGANYIRSGRMGGLSWNRGPTPGMSGSMAATARQRALNSMNNSKFNAMKAMGNESYMMNVPKSRYANSTGIHGITPVLSY